jgi:hypothetical protein
VPYHSVKPSQHELRLHHCTVRVGGVRLIAVFYPIIGVSDPDMYARGIAVSNDRVSVPYRVRVLMLSIQETMLIWAPQTATSERGPVPRERD